MKMHKPMMVLVWLYNYSFCEAERLFLKCSQGSGGIVWEMECYWHSQGDVSVQSQKLFQHLEMKWRSAQFLHQRTVSPVAYNMATSRIISTLTEAGKHSCHDAHQRMYKRRVVLS